MLAPSRSRETSQDIVFKDIIRIGTGVAPSASTRDRKHGRVMKKRYAVIAGIAVAIPLATISLVASGTGTDASASWATMDADADGALSPEEVASTPWEAKFDDMDANDDGKVTREEFKQYMASMQEQQDYEQDDSM